MLIENWFFVLVLLLCVGMHFFMHGRGHGGHSGRGRYGSGGHDAHDRPSASDSAPERYVKRGEAIGRVKLSATASGRSDRGPRRRGKEKRMATVGGVLVLAAALFVSGCAPGIGAGGMGGMGGCGMAGGGHGGHAGHEAADVATAVCPVCAMEIAVGTKTPRATYGGILYYFASEEHERLFIADPQKYLKPGASGVPGGAGSETHDH